MAGSVFSALSCSNRLSSSQEMVLGGLVGLPLRLFHMLLLFSVTFTLRKPLQLDDDIFVCPPYPPPPPNHPRQS